MRPFGKKSKKRPLSRRKTPHSLQPPTQEMLDVGLAAAMRTNDVRVFEKTSNRSIRVLERTDNESSIRVFEEATDFIEPEDPLKSTSIDEFINNFRESASEFLSSAYLMQRQITLSYVCGTLSTSLCEDVFALVEAQLGLLDDYLVANELINTETGNSLVIEALLSILRNLRCKQTNYKTMFLSELGACVAAANDFSRMGERVEHLEQSMTERYPHMDWAGTEEKNITATFRREASALIDMFETDAVCAAHRIASHVVQGIHEAGVSFELFSHDWEDKYVQNEVAVSMTRTLEDYLVDIQEYLEHEYLYHKVVAALIRSTVCLYVQCFVKKADSRRREMKRLNKKARDCAFLSASRAICRMNYDVELLREYFANVVSGTVPLERIVEKEFSVLVLLMECMWLAVGESDVDIGSLEEFVLVVHTRTGANSDVTRQFLSDLWVLMGPKNEHRTVENAIRMMDAELQLVSTQVEERSLETTAMSANDMACLRLDEMLKSLYQDRILQERSSMCGNIIRDVNEFRGEIKFRPGNIGGRDALRKLKEFRPLKRLLGDKDS